MTLERGAYLRFLLQAVETPRIEWLTELDRQGEVAANRGLGKATNDGDFCDGFPAVAQVERFLRGAVKDLDRAARRSGCGDVFQRRKFLPRIFAEPVADDPQKRGAVILPLFFAHAGNP